ncbi:MAG: SGNH/GDSL hydrolase family protein [Clostridia bacterium]|nr:SGNH/GDSL hydrolase family protein [Clostridia bacterium]
MTLTLDQIRSVTVGATAVRREADGIHFAKCTDAQVAAWGALNKDLGLRAQTTSGVRLDFHTDSRRIRVMAPAGGKFELLIDGLLRLACPGDRDVNAPIEADLCDELGEFGGSHRVTLAFPSHTVGVLGSVELDDGAALEPHVFDRKMLFIGDSITQGWQSHYDTAAYAWRVSNFFNADSIIQGIGGAYYHPSTFDIIDYDPDIVLVAYGTNDFGHKKTLEQFRALIAGYLDPLAQTYAGKQIFILSPIWRGQREGKTMGSFADCRRVIAEEAEKRGFVHIDGLRLVPAMPEMMADGWLHPNDVGFSYFAENLVRELQKYI